MRRNARRLNREIGQFTKHPEAKKSSKIVPEGLDSNESANPHQSSNTEIIQITTSRKGQKRKPANYSGKNAPTVILTYKNY